MARAFNRMIDAQNARGEELQRHRDELEARRARAHRRAAGGQGPRRGGQRGEERVPGPHEPRAAHAAERGAGLCPDPAHGRRAEQPAAGRPGHHPQQRRAPADADRRHPRPGPHRSRQDGDRERPARPGGPGAQRGGHRARQGRGKGPGLRDRRRSDVAEPCAGRREAPAPGADQSARQRRQVHPPGPCDAVRASPGPRPRRRNAALRGARQRRGHQRRGGATPVPAVRAGRRGPPALGRNRPGPGHQPPAGTADGRRCAGPQPAGCRQHLLVRADAAAGPTSWARSRPSRRSFVATTGRHAGSSWPTTWPPTG